MNSRVVLIHGLGRTSCSMFRVSRYLTRHNFATRRFGYSSRRQTIQEAARKLNDFLNDWYQESPEEGKLHLVTHSMGGILARYCEAHDLLPHVHRIVMLGPPNKGSEVADWFNTYLPRFFNLVLGPHGPRLGTDKHSYPARLPQTINHETAVIAGIRNHLLFTRWILPQPNDGVVSLNSTRVKGIRDWKAVKAGHTFMMNHPYVRELIVNFLRKGSF